MPHSKTTKKPEVSSSENNKLHVAEAAFRALQPELDAIPLAGLDPLKLDLQAAAVHALGVAEMLAEAEIRAKIVAMAKVSALNLQRVDQLEKAAWATWFVRHQLLRASAMHSEATLPTAIVEQGFELRGRMLKTLEYHLDGDAEAMAQIVHIRSGSGHLDLADDLSSVASMYHQHHDGIRHDKKNFRETDARDAQGLSAQILRLLGATTTPEQTLWKNYQLRAAKLLFQSYDEAMRVGRFLFFYDDPEGRFPTLFAATRSPASPPRGEKSPPAADPPSPPPPPADA